MKESITRHQGIWWHFFIKPFYGLCFQKKEGIRFSRFEVLLPEACQDFCALSDGSVLHLVCQDQAGSIIYLALTDNTWHKTVLLESKSPASYPKHFQMLPIGGFINLFYTIIYRDKTMLIHQILTAEERPPTVIDRILLSEMPFAVRRVGGTDIMVLYENEAGVIGSRLYRWSQKSFQRFLPLDAVADCRVCAYEPERGDIIRYSGIQRQKHTYNLLYFEQTTKGAYSKPITVYQDAAVKPVPVFSREGNKLYLIWNEAGSILSVYSEDDGASWSKPIRYMIPSDAQTVLYEISDSGKLWWTYGYAKEQDVVLYASPQLSFEPEKKERPSIQREGYDAEVFARSEGYMPEMPHSSLPDPLYSQLQAELLAVKEQLINLRITQGQLKARIEELGHLTAHAVVPLAEEEAIDSVLLNMEDTDKRNDKEAAQA